MSTLPMFKHSFPVSKLSRPDGIGKKRSGNLLLTGLAVLMLGFAIIGGNAMAQDAEAGGNQVPVPEALGPDPRGRPRTPPPPTPR